MMLAIPNRTHRRRPRRRARPTPASTFPSLASPAPPLAPTARERTGAEGSFHLPPPLPR